MPNKINAEVIDKTIALMKSNALHLKGTKFDMSAFYINKDGEDNDDVFSMENECGTTACIAGFVVLANGTAEQVKDTSDTEYHAAALMGLDVEDGYYEYDGDHTIAQDLFYAMNTPMSLTDINLSQAIRTLEHLKETGKVDWNV